MIARVVRVLETFEADRTVQSTSEIGRRAGLPSSTAHRVVEQLADEGLLEFDEDHNVRLGMRLWELALRGSTALRLRQAALPHMEWVQSLVRQHTQLAVLERGEALFLERLSHPDAGANIARVAGRLPLHASSAGLVLLAHAAPATRNAALSGPLTTVGPATITDPARLKRELTRIRRMGFAAAPASIEAVSTGVAVPIRETGRVVAALSAVLPREGDPDRAIPVLQEAAKRIEAELRATRP